jgi:hypothetical protein
MATSAQELLEREGFKRAGRIKPLDEGARCQQDIQWNASGFVVYAHVVGDQIKKFGITTPKLSARVGQNVSTLNKVIALLDGRIERTARWHSRPFDPFKRLAPPVIQSGQEIELWARECVSREEMEDLETRLNYEHRPDWTKEANRSRAVPQI